MPIGEDNAKRGHVPITLPPKPEAAPRGSRLADYFWCVRTFFRLCVTNSNVGKGSAASCISMARTNACTCSGLTMRPTHSSTTLLTHASYSSLRSATRCRSSRSAAQCPSQISLRVNRYLTTMTGTSSVSYTTRRTRRSRSRCPRRLPRNRRITALSVRATRKSRSKHMGAPCAAMEASWELLCMAQRSTSATMHSCAPRQAPRASRNSLACSRTTRFGSSCNCLAACPTLQTYYRRTSSATRYGFFFAYLLRF